MNVRLQYTYSFTAGVWIADAPPVFNPFVLTVDLITASIDMVEQNIAFDRINYYVNEVINNSFFIHQAEIEAIDALQTAGIRVITLPEVPYEQVIGLLLYNKLNAVMEGRICIDEIKISSAYGQNVVYMYSGEEIDNVFDVDGWWFDPEPTWRNKRSTGAKKKIVELPNNTAASWKDLDLHWRTDEAEEEPKQTVGVVMKFKQEAEETE